MRIARSFWASNTAVVTSAEAPMAGVQPEAEAGELSITMAERLPAVLPPRRRMAG
jgi:hypothetical protein